MVGAFICTVGNNAHLIWNGSWIGGYGCSCFLVYQRLEVRVRLSNSLIDDTALCQGVEEIFVETIEFFHLCSLISSPPVSVLFRFSGMPSWSTLLLQSGILSYLVL